MRRILCIKLKIVIQIITLIFVPFNAFSQEIKINSNISHIDNCTNYHESIQNNVINSTINTDPFENDSNFTFAKYKSFLIKLKDTSRYIVVPVNEFRQIHDSKKVIISLRHDMDVSLQVGYKMASLENELGIRSTYYVLHTANYYHQPNDMNTHQESILPTLQTMQNIFNHEIGWHNDLVTLDLVYKIDPVQFLHQELDWLRGNQINIYGSSAHGSPFHNIYKYVNYYFFEECSFPPTWGYPNNVKVKVGNDSVPIKKGRFSDFNLFYEAYFLDNNKYFSDVAVINGKQWNLEMLDLKMLKPGDRVIILTHPIHWFKKLEVSTNNINLGSDKDTIKPFQVTATTSWVIRSSEPWLSVNADSGFNNATLQITALSNSLPVERTAKIILSGFCVDTQTIKVTQGAKLYTHIPFENDSNFTFTKYASFLSKLKDTSRYIVVPLNDFSHIHDSTKIIIGLRHDVDVNLQNAYEMSRLENVLGIRSTYYILHSASYYHQPNDLNSHQESILPTLQTMQNEFNHEIGWHNDLVTLDLVYKIDPVQYLHQELNWLRGNQIKIYGSSSYSSPFQSLYKYVNYYFFEECSFPPLVDYPNNVKVKIGNDSVFIRKGRFSDFNLSYEANFLDNNNFFTDETIIKGEQWNFEMLDLNSLKPGDRLIILTHPVNWYKELSVSTNNIDLGFDSDTIKTFNINATTSWAINSSEPWLSVSNDKGINNAKVKVTAFSNSSTEERTAKLVVSGFCVDTQTIKVIQSAKVETYIPAVESNQIQIYPNPARDKLFIENIDLNTYIFIYNSQGILVMQQKLISNEIDIRKLGNGIYYINLISKGMPACKKFIK